MSSNQQHSDSSNKNQFTYWVGVCFSVNYILGSGFLTLPWAISQSGIIIGSLTLLVFSFLAISSSHMYLLVLERYVRITQYYKEEEENNLNSVKDSNLEKTKDHSTDETCLGNPSLDFICPSSRREGYLPIDNKKNQPKEKAIQMTTIKNPLVKSNVHYNNISQVDEDYIDTNQADSPSSESLFELENNAKDEDKGVEHIDLIVASDLFLGTLGKRLYLMMVSTYTYGCLWAYSTVFANSFSAHLDFFGSYSYYVYLFLFACFTVPLSLMELTEQVNIQVILTVFRIVMVLLMVLTTFQAIISDNDSFGEKYSPYSEDNELMYEETIKKVSFEKMHNLLPIAAYSFIFHHSIAALAEPLKDKRLIPSVFSMALVISMLSYIFVGVVLSVYFGDKSETSSNLNWLDYIGISTNEKQISFFVARVISFFIVLFPAIDVASAYPLNAITLGNNLMSAFNFIEDSDENSQYTSFSSLNSLLVNLLSKENKPKIFRLLACFPPILLSLLERDLGKITDITGLLAFPLAFIFPSILLFTSKFLLRKLNLKETRKFENYGCRIGDIDDDDADQEFDYQNKLSTKEGGQSAGSYPSTSSSPNWGISLTLWVNDYIGVFNIFVGFFIFIYIIIGLVFSG